MSSYQGPGDIVQENTKKKKNQPTGTKGRDTRCRTMSSRCEICRCSLEIRCCTRPFPCGRGQGTHETLPSLSSYKLLKIAVGATTVVYAFNSIHSTGRGQPSLHSEFRTTMATQRDPVSKKQTNQTQTEQLLWEVLVLVQLYVSCSCSCK